MGRWDQADRAKMELKAYSRWHIGTLAISFVHLVIMEPLWNITPNHASSDKSTCLRCASVQVYLRDKEYSLFKAMSSSLPVLINRSQLLIERRWAYAGLVRSLLAQQEVREMMRGLAEPSQLTFAWQCLLCFGWPPKKDQIHPFSGCASREWCPWSISDTWAMSMLADRSSPCSQSSVGIGIWRKDLENKSPCTQFASWDEKVFNC